MTFMRTGVVLLTILAATPAFADDPNSEAKFKALDAARLAIVDALDKHDAAAFEPYVDHQVVTEGLWFSTPACRKRFSTASIKAKDLRAFVACFAPVNVTQTGLLVTYGPGITMTVKLDVTDGKVTVQKLSSFVGDPAAPEIFSKMFERQRTAGDPKVALDDAARAELAALQGGVAAFRVCVDKTGKVKSHKMVDLDAKTAIAKSVAAAVKTWQFKPFEIRGKAIPICSVAFIRAKDQ
jgi:hypothetical protein